MLARLVVYVDTNDLQSSVCDYGGKGQPSIA